MLYRDRNAEIGTPLRPRDCWILALILAATLLAYWPALHGTLLWDDDGHLTKPALQSIAGLGRIWTDLGATQQYYPALHSAFWLEHRLWGDDVVGYHLVNVLLHASSAFLVFAIMRRLQIPGAWLGALVFALHPLEVESVAWISEQKNTLSGAFCLGALYVYLDFDQTRRRLPYAVASCLFILAVLTKTVTGTLPATLLVLLWWQRGRIRLGRDCLPLVPWFGLGLAGGAETSWVERYMIGAQGTDFALTLAQRLLLAGRAVCFYFAKLVWPDGLAFIYPRWILDASDGSQYLYLIAVLFALGALLLLARKARGPLAGFLIFAGTLVPALGFVNVYPFLFSFVADHFQYLAGLGVIVPASAGLTMLAGQLPARARRLAPFPGALLVAVLAVLTWNQSAAYRNSRALYEQTLLRNPDCWMAHLNLANTLALVPDKRVEAISHYEAALRLKPDFAFAHNNLGKVLASQPGRLAEAIGHFQAALRINPELAEANTNLGHAFERDPDRLHDAIAQFGEAVRLRPDAPDTHFDLANALARDPSRQAEAITEYGAALRLMPGASQVHNNLGRVLARTPGHLPEAVFQFKEAIRCDPRLAEAHANLGAALAKIRGQRQAAIAEFHQALRFGPNLPLIHFDLANALTEEPDGRSEAIAEYEAALRLDPKMAEADYNLGNLLLRMPGHLDEAISHYEAALKARPDWESLRQLIAGLKGNKP